MKPWTDVHRTLGIVAVVPLAFMGLTGSAMVVLRSAQPLLAPAPHRTSVTGPIRNADAIVAAAVASVPRAKASSYAPPATPHDYAIVGLRDEAGTTQMLVDPQTLAVRPSADSVTPIYDWLHRIHQNLFAGGAGGAIVGIFGLLLLALVIAGVPIWFRPARRARREPFTFRRGLLRAHGVTGAWVFLLVGFLGATGTIMAYPVLGATLRTVAAAPVAAGCRQGRRERGAAGDAGGSGANIQGAIDASLAAVPGASLTSVQLGRGPMRIILVPAGAALGAPGIAVTIGPDDAVSCVSDPRTAGAGPFVNAWIRPLHSGALDVRRDRNRDAHPSHVPARRR